MNEIVCRIVTTQHNLKWLREDTHKKKIVFSVVGPLRFYPPYINGLVVHATLFYFFCLIIAWNNWQFFFFSNFWAKKAGFIEKKKWFFAWWSGGFTLPIPLLVRPLQKTTYFLCVSSLSHFKLCCVLLFCRQFHSYLSISSNSVHSS